MVDFEVWLNRVSKEDVIEYASSVKLSYTEQEYLIEYPSRLVLEALAGNPSLVEEFQNELLEVAEIQRISGEDSESWLSLVKILWSNQNLSPSVRSRIEGEYLEFFEEKHTSVMVRINRDYERALKEACELAGVDPDKFDHQCWLEDYEAKQAEKRAKKGL